MPSLPFMKFYTSDWRAQPELRLCSLAARGLWIEMLCLMHGAQPRGHLLVNGKPVTESELAALIQSDVTTVANHIAELEKNGVFDRRKNGIIVSRRMEKDENKSRKNRANGEMGGNPNLCKQTIKKESDNPSSVLDTRDQILDKKKKDISVVLAKRPNHSKTEPPEFSDFWQQYPKRFGSAERKGAVAAYLAALNRKIFPVQILDGAMRYAAHCDAAGKTGTEFVKQARTWLNADGWTETYPENSQRNGHAKSTVTSTLDTIRARIAEELRAAEAGELGDGGSGPAHGLLSQPWQS